MDNLRVYMGTDFIWLNIVDWVRLGVLQGNRGTAWGSSGEDWGPSAVGLGLIPGQATRSYMPQLTVWKLQDPNEGRRSRMPPRPSADKQVNCSPYKKNKREQKKNTNIKKQIISLGNLPLTEKYFFLPTVMKVALVIRNPPANAGDIRDTGSIFGLGRSPGEGNGNPLQYSCLGNPMDRGAWWATVHGVTKELDMTKAT